MSAGFGAASRSFNNAALIFPAKTFSNRHNLKDVILPTMLAGIAINTSESVNQNYTQTRLQRWTGETWEKFGDVVDAAQALRKASEIEWQPMIILNYPSSSASATLKPVGFDKAIGVMVGTNMKDPMDPAWANDKAIIDYKAFFEKYMPGSDISDSFYIFGYAQGMLLEQIIKQCGE